MSKYIDLSETILDSQAYVTANDALRWLDEHPDQVPGRTITESDFCEAVDKAHAWTDEGFARTVLNRLGITVIPDPKPTNAELLEQLHDQYRMFPAQHLPGNGSLADYLDHKGVKAPDHD